VSLISWQTNYSTLKNRIAAIACDRRGPRNVEKSKAKIGGAKKDRRRLAMVASTAPENNQQYDKIHDEINCRRILRHRNHN
jgi:hypothetical protein